MMRQFLIVLIFSLITVSNVFGKAEYLPEGVTVNQLLKDGYRLVETGEINDDGKIGIIYHLIKGKTIVTCGMRDRKIECVKP